MFPPTARPKVCVEKATSRSLGLGVNRVCREYQATGSRFPFPANSPGTSMAFPRCGRAFPGLNPNRRIVNLL
jgi:hypothetical protein